MRNLKIIGQEKVCKMDKPASLSIKTVKNVTPEQTENGFFFQIWNTATDIK